MSRLAGKNCGWDRAGERGWGGKKGESIERNPSTSMVVAPFPLKTIARIIYLRFLLATRCQSEERKGKTSWWIIQYPLGNHLVYVARK